MLTSTLEHLRCPRMSCRRAKGLKLRVGRGIPLDGPGKREEIVSGSVVCESCRGEYPILGGVAILVEDVGDYLLSHLKGIAREIPESEFPKAFRVEMSRARRELAGPEHIEEDLESQRVTALYVMTQYLEARQLEKLAMSAEMRELVKRHWDQGPLAHIRAGLERRSASEGNGFSLLELGCGAGGLLPAVAGRLSRYLGVDSSFSGIVTARRLALGIDHRKAKSSIQVPEDLLFGVVTHDMKAELKAGFAAREEFLPADADFVVGDVTSLPLRREAWDVCAALNVIDMLDRPESLPEIQKELIRPGGWAIQSSPYVWHPLTAKALAREYPRCRDSAEVAARLYEEHGFTVERESAEIPWLFFKNSRQIELYSVDLFFAHRASARATLKER